jgi:uncharacterized protein (TIGR02231 family)
MRKLFFPALLALTTLGAQAQTPSRLVLPLRAVTLYFNGAELHHQGEISLPAGPAELRLAGLSPSLTYSSLQAEVTGAELESVELVAAPVPRPGAAPVTLLDSLRVAQATLRKLKTEEASLAAEREFLQQNKQIERVSPGRWVEETQRGAAFYAARIGALSQRDTDLKESLQNQTVLVAALSRRSGQGPASTGPAEVLLRLQVPRASTVRLELSYLGTISSSSSGWEPEYELRVSENNPRQLRVVSRASLRNYTGLAWTNVPVTLRTAAPSDDVSRPSLDPWTVGFGRAGNEGEGLLDDFAVKGAATVGTAEAPAPDAPDLGTRLSLPAPVTLASASSRAFKLAEQTLPMRLEYLAIPKRAEGVFLVGKVANWNQVNFLAETAEVFFRGAYVGETALDTRAYTDTLEVALGRDPQVQLTRTKREDFESPANSGNRKKTRLAYEITVKNTHSYPIRLRLLDQVPVSQEKEISVKVQDIGGAQLDEASGKLTWLLTLPAGASRPIPIAFTVEAPADKRINLRNDRSIKSPKFR